MTTMTPDNIANLGILDPEYLRSMGESEASIEYLTSRRAETLPAPASPTVLEQFDAVFRPNLPNPNTGD